LLSQQLGKLPNTISIEGHTDSRPYAGKSGYDNWDLSADRANEARRLMQQEGLKPGQISQVRGFADRRPRIPNHPDDSSNRRISVIVQYQVMNGAEVPLPTAVTSQNATPPGKPSPDVAPLPNTKENATPSAPPAKKESASK
jgi:chemotaxis protein MotB